MIENYKPIVFITIALIIYALKARKIKPYVLLGGFMAITLQISSTLLTSFQKAGVILILTSLVGIYDLTYLQKVKAAWRYLLVPFIYGLYLIF